MASREGLNHTLRQVGESIETTLHNFTSDVALGVQERVVLVFTNEKTRIKDAATAAESLADCEHHLRMLEAWYAHRQTMRRAEFNMCGQVAKQNGLENEPGVKKFLDALKAVEETCDSDVATLKRQLESFIAEVKCEWKL
jgi:hypothetical protein